MKAGRSGYYKTILPADICCTGFVTNHSVFGSLKADKAAVVDALRHRLDVFPGVKAQLAVKVCGGGVGGDIQRLLAVLVVFGLFTSTFLTLFVLPSMCEWVE